MSGTRKVRTACRNLILLSGVLLTAACTGARAITDVSWQLAALEDTVLPKGQPVPAFLVFADSGKVSGAGFCNPVRGRYELDVKARTLAFSRVTANWKACPELARELRMLELLRQTTRYARRGDQLLLYGADRLLLTFSGRRP